VRRSPTAPPERILALDVGGTKIKILASGETEPRKAKSGPTFTPGRMVEEVRQLARGWRYDAVSIGLPAQVGPNGPIAEPGNLGPGWVGFDYAAAFDCPVRIANDAAMQALGSYDGGRMLFLGLGTGVGSALIVDQTLVTLELGQRHPRPARAREGGQEGLAQGGARSRAAAAEGVPRRLRDAWRRQREAHREKAAAWSKTGE
jgi:polyphosphate glucokinase